MELKLEAVEEGHLPAGCVLGVRIGDVLKQGKYEPARSYNFPQLERRRNAKIDVYKHLGSCMVALDPEAKANSEVSVTSTDPAFAGIKLRVSVQNGSASEAEKRERENRAKTLKSQAKDYLQKHSVEERLAQAVKALLKEQPENPTEFLCAHLRGQDPAAAAPPAAAAAQPTGAIESEPPPPLIMAAPKAAQETTADLLRLQARDALVMASQDGSLEQVLNDIKLETKDEAPVAPELSSRLRQEACDVLMKASLDGSLGAVLAEIVADKEPGVKWPPPALAETSSSSPPAASAPPAEQGVPSPSGGSDKPPAMMMSSMVAQGPAFASMGLPPGISMI